MGSVFVVTRTENVLYKIKDKRVGFEKVSNLPAKVAQLVRANTRECGSRKWHMISDSYPTTNDTLNLPDTNCCRVYLIDEKPLY